VHDPGASIDAPRTLRNEGTTRGGSDEEHIITAGWWCNAAVMMDYHRRLVRQSGGDSYQPACSYVPTVKAGLSPYSSGNPSTSHFQKD